MVQKFDSIWQSEKSQKEQRKAQSLKSRNGSYIEFISSADHDLITKSLEDTRQGIRLLNIRTINKEVRAVVYIPAGKENCFLKKIKDFETQNTKDGNPKNAKLISSIEDVSIALVESLWTDPPSMLPEQKTAIWIEAWLSVSDNEESQKEEIEFFLATLQAIGIEAKPNYLAFPERAIVLIYASREQLVQLLISSDMLAEFRVGQEASGFWTNESSIDQAQWVNDLLSRLNIQSSNVKVCILDSGVNNGHQLIQPVLNNQNCLTVEPSWGTDDHASGSGHGWNR